MRLAARLTLDGLVRALRAHAHRLADEIEEGRSRIGAGDDWRGQPTRRSGADDDDVSSD